MVRPAISARVVVKVLKAKVRGALQAEVSRSLELYVGSGITVRVHMEMIASAGMYASPAPKQVS